MPVQGKQRVCIHCRQAENIEPIGVVEGDREVGLVFCCTACQGRMQGYTMDIFLYSQDGEKTQRLLH